ncbi:uncharacterized protein LOC142223697 [Haematobia irritans]|uniref:uncharacterized protein LOC142223697 n=1 Tax=Haematobia irritans TaxID=7368 RepID=UPI003F4F7771
MIDYTLEAGKQYQLEYRDYQLKIKNMKIFTTTFIFALTLISQISAIPFIRIRRSDEFVQRFEKLGDLSKRLIPQTETVVKATLPKIPKSNIYNKYRIDLLGYLNSVNLYHSKRGRCYEKSFDLIGKYAELMERYEKRNATPEAKIVQSLLKESGSEALNRDLEAWIDAYEKSNFDVESENLNSSDTKKVMTLLAEMC